MEKRAREPQRDRSRSRPRAPPAAGTGTGGPMFPFPPNPTRSPRLAAGSPGAGKPNDDNRCPADPPEDRCRPADPSEVRCRPADPSTAGPVSKAPTPTTLPCAPVARPDVVAEPSKKGPAASMSAASTHHTASTRTTTTPPTAARPRRSPSAPSRMEEDEVPPLAQLKMDISIIADLEARSALSRPLLDMMSKYIDNRRAILNAAPAPVPQRTSKRPQSRDAAAAPEASETPKRPCLLQPNAALAPRDPRRRPSAAITTPTSAPSPQPEASAPHPTTANKGKSFADALRASGPSNAPLRPAAPPQSAPPSSSATIPPPEAPSGPRIPPLVVDDMPDWAFHIKKIKNILGKAPNSRAFGQGVRFNPESVEEYRIVQKYLSDAAKDHKLSWFTYDLPAERSKKMAVRGLPVATTPEELIAALNELGYTAEYARPIKARKGRPGCIFFVIMAATPNLIPDIYGTTELLDMPGITIEAWRGKKGPAQCHRCQAFRHSSHGCHRRIACVRCGEEHFASDCTLASDAPAKCINCGGPHTANYAGCPERKRELQNIKAGIAARTRAELAARNASEAPRSDQVNTVPAEAHAPSLMAPANPPAATRDTRRRRNRSARARATTAPTTPAPPTSQAQAPTATAAPVAANPLQPAPQRALPPRAAAPAVASTAGPRPDLVPVDRVIDLLRDVLVALREGQDPAQTVLTAIMKVMECLART